MCTRREDSAKWTIGGCCGLWQGNQLHSQGEWWQPSGDAMVCGKAINCIPRGNDGNRLTSDRRREETTHPGKECMPRQRGSFRHNLRCYAYLQCELCSQGEWKWHFQCQGHVTFQVLGAWDILSARGMSFSDHKTTISVIGSSQVWLALLFTIVTTAIPTPDQSWSTVSRFLFLNG